MQRDTMTLTSALTANKCLKYNSKHDFCYSLKLTRYKCLLMNVFELLVF